MMSEDPASAAAVGGARWLALLRGDVTYRRRFGLLGREWDLFPGVFSPIQSHSTGFFSRAVPQREGGTFLDVGCGSGVMAVEAALAGCREVLAVDLDTVAVDNTRHNARLHGAGAVSAQVSDCFADIPPQLRFDTVFWSLPYAAVPADDPSALDSGAHTICDVGHRCLRAYLSGVRGRLAPGGRAFLGFSDMGDHTALVHTAEENGWSPQLLAASSGEPNPNIEHHLYELISMRR